MLTHGATAHALSRLGGRVPCQEVLLEELLVAAGPDHPGLGALCALRHSASRKGLKLVVLSLPCGGTRMLFRPSSLLSPANITQSCKRLNLADVDEPKQVRFRVVAPGDQGLLGAEPPQPLFSAPPGGVPSRSIRVSIS